MSHDQEAGSLDQKPSTEECLLVGVPALAAILFLLAELAWMIAGKPPELSPTRWLGDALALAASIVVVVFVVLLIAAMLWGLRSLSLRLGSILLRSCRRWRHP